MRDNRYFCGELSDCGSWLRGVSKRGVLENQRAELWRKNWIRMEAHKKKSK